MSVSLRKITKLEKALYLAYDQGLEHGPSHDFNDENVNPLYVIDIAKRGQYNGLVFHKGIAEKYRLEIKKSKVPLILKLNGKTKLYEGEPVSGQIATVEEAVKLGARAVGFTIYIGSKFESKMIEQFSKIEMEAHDKGLPLIAWVYPRGKSVEGKKAGELLAYSCRVGLEIGADIVKVHWNGNSGELKWAVESAGKCKVVIAGGLKTEEKVFLQGIKHAINAGVIGLAVGRNVWQHKRPLEITKKIKKIIWKGE